MDEEERIKKPASYEIAQDLSQLSIEEIEETISLLEAEIVRLREEKDQKGKQMSAAEALFKN